MKKLLISILAILFCHLALAESQQKVDGVDAMQFDPVKNAWPLTFSLVPGVKSISQLKTLGKYSFAFDYMQNTISFHDGEKWSSPLSLQNIPQYGNLVLIPKYPDTIQNPQSWIVVLGRNHSANIFYFDGNSTFPSTLPFPLETRNRFFLQSHHQAWAIDYKTNRVFWTNDIEWNMMSPLPTGKLITVTTDNVSGDLYALELDSSRNQYFITHLLRNGQWDNPLYINFFFSSSVALTDFMVMDEGKTISVFYSGVSKNIFISQNGGQNFTNTGSIPYTIPIQPLFISLYNGNKGNIFWSIFSQHSPKNYYDTIAYFDPHADTPTWVTIEMPEAIWIPDFEYETHFNTISEDGTQLWISGFNQNQQSRLFYYDIKLKTFVDPHLPQNIFYNTLQASNGKVFGIALSSTHVVSLSFDGTTWQVNPIATVFQGGLSYGNRNDWQVTSSLRSLDRAFVEDKTKNIWIAAAYGGHSNN